MSPLKAIDPDEDLKSETDFISLSSAAEGSLSENTEENSSAVLGKALNIMGQNVSPGISGGATETGSN
jgi:hypothetical protein